MCAAEMMAVRVLDPVQELDQEVAPPRGIAEQRPHLRQRPRVDLAALRTAASLPRLRIPDDVDDAFCSMP